MIAPRLLLTALLALVCLLISSGVVSAEKYVEGIAAQVGNDIVLASEVMEFAGPVEERMRQQGASEAEVAMVRRDALERLIENKLLASVVERLELTADREEIDAAIDAIASENGLTLEQLLASISSHGLGIEEYRDKIKGEIERSKVVNAMVRSRVQISDKDVEALYADRFGDQRSGGEEVYVRHLVVMSRGVRANSAEEACALVGEARKRIAAGDLEFTQVASRVSDMNAERGGDLGWIHSEDLAPWMAKTIRSMRAGELSTVVEMPFGCNLLELVDRREFKPVSLEQASPQLRNVLFQQKSELEYTKWLDVLRTQTYIEKKGPFGG